MFETTFNLDVMFVLFVLFVALWLGLFVRYIVTHTNKPTEINLLCAAIDSASVIVVLMALLVIVAGLHGAFFMFG